jgi:hypothetical protein
MVITSSPRTREKFGQKISWRGHEHALPHPKSPGTFLGLQVTVDKAPQYYPRAGGPMASKKLERLFLDRMLKDLGWNPTQVLEGGQAARLLPPNGPLRDGPPH